MLTVTGIVAVILVFLAGPYRTLQKGRSHLPSGTFRGRAIWGSRLWASQRLGGRQWGPVLSIFTHGNVSVLALAAVALHVALRLGLGTNLTFVATYLFGLTFLSGLGGFYVTRTPSRRRRWLYFHRRLTYVFYAAIAWHVLTKGVLGLPVLALLAFALLLWKRRPQMGRFLERYVTWPFRRSRRLPQKP